MPRSVIIDGVEYIPAKDALANADDIRRGLLMSFWGYVRKGDPKLEEYCEDLYVIVTDSPPWEDCITIDQVIDDIAKVTEGIEQPKKIWPGDSQGG